MIISSIPNLFPAIPNLWMIRRGKPKDLYETPLIDTSHPLHLDPLVDPRGYGFHDAHSYYAKPNRLTKTPLPGVEDLPLVRRTVVRQLEIVEFFLRNSYDVEEALGCNCHVRIDDAIRTYETQWKARYEGWPTLIRVEHPEIPEEQIDDYIGSNSLCALPSHNSPHVTGGAVDVVLVNAETGESLDRGKMAIPEAYEEDPETAFQCAEKYLMFDSEIGISYEEFESRFLGVRSLRRVQFYAFTMIGGFAINPGEIWHFSFGDALWGYMTGSRPHYGEAVISSD